MKLHPIQTSFETGVISPLMLGRSDSAPYQQGLLGANNMLVDSRGPAKSRAGTRFATSFVADCARLETFQVDVNTYFNMVFGDTVLAITSITGGIPQVELVTNPHFLEGSTGWVAGTVGGSSEVDFDDGICTLSAQNGAANSAYIQQTVSVTDGEQPYEIIVNTFGTAPYSIRVGSAPGLGDYVDAVSSEGEFRATFTPGLVGIVDVFIQVLVSDGNTAIVRSVSIPESADQLDFDTPWSCDQIEELYFVQAPGGESVYILHPEVQPHKLVYDVSANLFNLTLVIFEDPASTDPLWIAPPEWGPDLHGSWPGVGAIFQGRLWLMATLNEPEVMWGSRSGEYEKFYVTDVDAPVASDAIMHLPMEHYGQIQWAIGSKRLIIGTSNSEYVLASPDGLLRPGSIQISRQSSYGSARVQPTQVNDQILYVSSDRRKVRAMSYSDNVGNWISDDMLYLSEHLSKPRIKDIAWVKNPDNLLWCLLLDGTMLSCTYERNNNVLGWMPHDTQGSFDDIAVGELFGTSYLNVLATRLPGVINYELMFSTESITPPLDAQERHEDPTPFTVVSGLDHLEGLTVQIVADGAVRPEQVVVGGEITLTIPASDVYIGLGYDTEITTLPLDKGSPTGSGTSHMKRWNRIYVRLLDSAKPIINGDRPPTRSPSTPMNTSEPTRTEDISVGNLGWDRNALVHVKQDLPKHLTVLAIFGELGQENL